MSDAAGDDGEGSVQDPREAARADPAQQPSEESPAPAETAPAEAVPAEAEKAEKKTRPSLVVRYGLMKQIGEFRHNLKEPPPVGAMVVVRTERGVERGMVVVNVCDGDGYGRIRPHTLNDFLKACGKEYPFRREGKVLRLANHQDMVDYRHLYASGHEEATFCREQIREQNLPMRLVTVEHLLGGGRIIFYFAAESRVDFRELVRCLASQYHTRIEMRQVGARDEARLVADYERCGQRCCCQRFLQYLQPVSMRMAKTQKATLDPSKISGRCGRLMCCLRYEDAGYEELRKKLPRRNTWVRTAECVGRVADTHILTQLVRLVLIDNSKRVVSVEDIIERDVPAPSPDDKPSPPRPPRGTREPAPVPEADSTETAAPGETPPDEAREDQQPRRRRNRRRRKKTKGAPDAQPTVQGEPRPAPPAGESAAAPSGRAPRDGAEQQSPRQGADRSPPKRRRRRKRKNKKPPRQGGT